MTDAEKLTIYHRIVEIVEDQMALQKHIRQKRDRFDDILISQADAYSRIVDAVVGHRNALLSI